MPAKFYLWEYSQENSTDAACFASETKPKSVTWMFSIWCSSYLLEERPTAPRCLPPAWEHSERLAPTSAPDEPANPGGAICPLAWARCLVLRSVTRGTDGRKGLTEGPREGQVCFCCFNPGKSRCEGSPQECGALSHTISSVGREGVCSGRVWPGGGPGWSPDEEHAHRGQKASMTSCAARGLLLKVVWQPGRERSLGEKGYMCICMAESLLCHLKLSQCC